MNRLLLGICLLFFEVASGFVHKCVRVGIDYGPRLIGIAYSDYFGTVYPYTTVKNTGNLTQISEAVATFATTLSAAEIILGVPIDNSASVIYTLCSGKVKVRLFDERYSTQEARYKQKMDKGKASLDAMAAACILERYIEDKGVGSMTALPCSYPPPNEIAAFNYNLIGTYVRMRHHAEDSEDWHEVKAYVNNYKVYSPPYDTKNIIREDSVTREDENDHDTDEYEEDEEDDGDTKLQREIVAQRRPRGMSKAAWKLRLLSTNKKLLF